MLEAVSSKRLLKTQQAGTSLAGAAVICKMWRLAIALQLPVVPSGVCKWSIHLFADPNPVYNHTFKYMTALSETSV
jgi:hypothetical protein